MTVYGTREYTRFFYAYFSYPYGQIAICRIVTSNNIVNLEHIFAANCDFKSSRRNYEQKRKKMAV